MLARLKADESAGVLRSILERHPDLAAEAEEIAKATVTDVDGEAVAEEVEQAVLDLDDLNSRAGRHSWGYCSPLDCRSPQLADAVTGSEMAGFGRAALEVELADRRPHRHARGVAFGAGESHVPEMALILAVGLGCIGIFIGSVWAGTLPALFLINAVLLAVQVVLVTCLFPWTAAEA